MNTAKRSRAGSALFDLGDHDRISMRGADAAELLHRLLTADVKALSPGTATAAFLLKSTGRIEVVFELLRLDAETFWADVGPGRGAATIELISRFIFTEDVELTPLERTALALEGPGSATLLAALGVSAPPAGTHRAAEIAGRPTRILPVDRTGRGGFDLWIAPGDAPAIGAALEAAGARLGDAATLEALRVAGAVPAWGSEYGPESTPLEISGLRGVADRKGCYPGQEVIERMLTGGRPPRTLIALELDGPATVGEAVSWGDEPVGALTSVATQPDGRVFGLALVKRRAAAAGAYRCGAVTARLRERPPPSEPG